MQLFLDDADAVILREVLDAALRDLRFEIADTDNAQFKARLRDREQKLRALLEPFGGPLTD